MLSLLSGFLIKLVLPAVGSALSALALRILNQQLKRVNISLTSEQEARVRELVRDAVLQVEEIARRDKSLTSADKASLAEDLVKSKLPDLSTAEAQRQIDAVLPEVRKQLAPSTPATFGR